MFHGLAKARTISYRLTTRKHFLKVVPLRTFSLSACLLSDQIRLRDYQQEAINKVLESISRGINRPAVVLATGGGKTVVFSHLIRQIKPSSPTRGNKTLVLAHKEELVRQATDSIRKANPTLKVDIDMRLLKPADDADVIVGSVPTLVRMSRLERYDPLDFKAIILDECHHATARSWLKILEYFKADTSDLQIYVIGFTATMERSDGQSLGSMFDEIVFERGLLTMVNNKELVDVKFSCIDVDVDLSKVATKKHDYEITSLSNAINNDEVNLLVALSYLKLKKQYDFKSTLMFCVDVDHCKTLCGVLQREGVNAQYVTGDTAKHERAEIIQDFKDGIVEVLCNVLVFTEGTDIPNIDSLFLARPTKSRPLLVQMIGRGLRLHEGKSHCHVVDIAGTRGTGIQSVPTLFSLPPEYTIHGKTYEELMKEKEEYDEAEEMHKREKALQKELTRRADEENLHNKMLEMQKLHNKMSLKFTTFDGFIALETNDVKEYEDSKNIHKILKNSKLNWIRLQFDVWGYQVGVDEFYLINRCYDKNEKVYFVLTLSRFVSPQQRLASKFKVGKITQVSELENNTSLKVVINKAEAMLPTMRPNYMGRRANENSLISKKQVLFIESKLIKKAQQYYDLTPDLEADLRKKISQFDKSRASDLIFACKYSTRALWLRWELQKLLGPDKRAKLTIKKLIDKDGNLKKTSSLAHTFANS